MAKDQDQAKSGKATGEGKEDAGRQILLRVPEDVYEILEAAKTVTRSRSMQALLGEELLKLAETFAKEPEVQSILRTIREYEARQSGRLKRIDTSRRKRATGQ
jgi:hypothetical protein